VELLLLAVDSTRSDDPWMLTGTNPVWKPWIGKRAAALFLPRLSVSTVCISGTAQEDHSINGNH
jgi:hypothetical protein